MLSFSQLCQFGSKLALEQGETSFYLLELLFLLEIALPLLLADIRPKLNLLLLQGQPRLSLLRLFPRL